ncbi:MAG: hypothetical protein HYW57_00340 [Ignavibacteriales bacterium]|nr:hypothetical protein [Ignavibacteriales bacterium]
MFAGTIGRVGRRFTINIQVIDVATAQIVSSKPRQHDGAIEDLAGDIIPEIAQEMIEDLTGRRLATGVRTTGGGASWLLWVGGAVLVGGGAAAAVILTQKKEGDGNGGTEGRKSLPSGPALP